MSKQNFGGVYANMEFPTYEFREYPKHVPTGPDGQYQIANNAREEAEIRGTLQNKTDALAAEEAHPFDPEREALINRAKDLGVPINRRWSISKLKAEIELKQRSVDDLPPEENLTHETIQQVLTSAAEDEEDKDALIAEAKSLGIAANKVWGIQKLKHSIEEAKRQLQD